MTCSGRGCERKRHRARSAGSVSGSRVAGWGGALHTVHSGMQVGLRRLSIALGYAQAATSQNQRQLELLREIGYIE
jgi:hypothetical protein